MTQDRSTRFDHLRRSEADGSQEGGLAALVAGISGMVSAAALLPGALTSFWVWMMILSVAIAVGSAAQNVACWNNSRLRKRKP